MEWLFVAILRGIGFILLAIFLLGMVLHLVARFFVPNRYEWLKVLSHTEWKNGLRLHREMEKLKSTSLGRLVMYSDLELLETEKIITTRVVDTIVAGHHFCLTEYRLTQDGQSRKVADELALHDLQPV